MTRSMSPEVLSDLIGTIYDCVFDPQRWENVLEAIRVEFDFVTAALGVTPLVGGMPAVHASAIHVTLGMDPEVVRVALASLGNEFLELWGGMDKVQAFPLDEPIICSQITNPDTWPNNAYYRAIGLPLDVFDGVGLCVARDPSMVGHLGFGVHRSLGAIDDAHVAGLRLVSPHIRRAVTISGLFDLKAIEAAAFTSTIDALAAGVVLVDENNRIVHANAIASAMLTSDEPIRSEQGRLSFSYPAARAALEAAVQHAALDEMKLGQRGMAVPVRRANGEPLVIHVLPLKRGDIRRAVTQRAVAALFIAPAALLPRLPTDALTLLYDLTPAETRIFEFICEGKTQAEISSILGIAVSTVKTHLLSIFEKTGCRRQLDLVKLAANLSLPV